MVHGLETIKKLNDAEIENHQISMFQTDPEVYAEERRLERLLPLFVRVFNAGYQAGHQETIEGRFSDVHESDKETYHSDVLAELLVELIKVNHENIR